MDTQQNLQFLRLLLLDMAKLSQRAVDYATKGYRLGSPEFCRYVRRGDRQINDLRRSITNLCHKLIQQHKIASDSEALTNPALDAAERFAQSSLRICDALHATSIAAAEIAHHTMLLLEDAGWAPGCEVLEKVCYLTNRLLCLCIIALFKRESQHAETVLQHSDGGHLFEQAFHKLRHNPDRKTAIPVALELGITSSLKQIATETHEIAEAIVFWLESSRCASPAIVRH